MHSAIRFSAVKSSVHAGVMRQRWLGAPFVKVEILKRGGYICGPSRCRCEELLHMLDITRRYFFAFANRDHMNILRPETKFWTLMLAKNGQF